MSSKRGRKRNDNLPPNRARDVQRAFRARRAAHLEALESRVAELEEENSLLRAALNLPPASRPTLGKGPTGKDKPKPAASKPSASSDISSLVASLGSNPCPLSRTESPLSTGSASGHSRSPDPMSSGSGLSVPSQTSPSLDPTGWSENMFGDKDPDQSVSSNFSIPSSSHTSHNSPFPQIPRSVANDIFPSTPGFSSSDDKSFGYLHSDQRRSYNDYSHPLMSGHSPGQPPLPSLSSNGDATDLASFLPRRALAEPDRYRTLMSHIQASQNGLQTPAPRMSQSALLNVVDAEFDLPGGTERRYPRLH